MSKVDTFITSKMDVLIRKADVIINTELHPYVVFISDIKRKSQIRLLTAYQRYRPVSGKQRKNTIFIFRKIPSKQLLPYCFLGIKIISINA